MKSLFLVLLGFSLPTATFAQTVTTPQIPAHLTKDDVDNHMQKNGFPNSTYPYWSALNGCGSQGNEWIPDSFLGLVDFTSICNRHDACYKTIAINKNFCDQQMKQELLQECNTVLSSREKKLKFACKSDAQLYYFAVSTKGDKAFQRDQTNQQLYINALEQFFATYSANE